ncbi:nuclease-related domain-containing protein [Bacillus sp. DJP31]|uniref:nuclease-related domain-containing protein n=1 Tax=Bacillus sp. DJP31 TaxID=3409789 RepID=UPI003BB5068B
MIVKKREKPIHIQQIEALSSRISKVHPKYQIIFERLLRENAGYYGEKATDFHLSFLPEEKYLILHNMRLFDGKNYFQIDTLLLTTSFIQILEIKNLKGILIFDPEFNQLIRILDGIEEGFPDPILQVERQTTQLKYWLVSQNLPSIPIESLVVISNPSSIIKAASKPHLVSKKVIHSGKLPLKLTQFEQIHRDEILSLKELKKLSRLLLKKHEPLLLDILEKYQLTRKDIITGIHCPHCKQLGLKRLSGSWHCIACNSTSKDAHYSGLKDIALLLDSSISNKEAREFLHIKSQAVATKLLSSMSLPYTGENKGRRYDLSQFI